MPLATSGWLREGPRSGLQAQLKHPCALWGFLFMTHRGTERASDNTTHINHSGEQFMKEKLSVFGMTLEELNRSQFEEGTFSPIVQLAFFSFFLIVS